MQSSLFVEVCDVYLGADFLVAMVAKPSKQETLTGKSPA